MGPPPPCPPQGLCFSSLWPWRVGEQSVRLDRMEGVEGGEDGGLRFFLQFDPGKLDRALLGASLSALFSRVLGWTDKTVEGRGTSVAGGQESAAAAVVSAAALTAAVSVCLAAVHASRRRPRLARRPRRAAMAAPSSAARTRCLRASHHGLRILSSKDETLENVIHGTSIGAGEDEPVIVARVETTDADTAIANGNGGETEDAQSEAEHGKEAERLRELWLSLVEREQRLELRLQELEGLREQEATVRELENRVAAAAMEARLMELKVASLQEENGRLRAQLEELGDARAELARAKEKLRAIKTRVQEEQEEARREAAGLRARVAELEKGGEEKAAAMATEVAALREANAALEEENMALALRLQEAEQAASSVLLALEADMVEEAQRLRDTNETLTRQIEELRSDHCAHVEELVYLKWVNACLRHELSEHGLQPPYSVQHQDHDGMSAMELSKSMSFRSSERAKQLMLRYGHPGLDPALFSPLHDSIDGNDYYEPARRSPAVGTSVTSTPATSTAAAASGKKSGQRKHKFLGNFKKLLPGGGKKGHSSSHGHGGSERSSRQELPPPSDEYLEKAMQWLSKHDVLDFDHSYETTPLSSCDRTPPSSVTTATTRGVAVREGDAAATLARSKSDGGKTYGREASPYRSLRPDHPANEPGVRPEKWEQRRRSEELKTTGQERA